jgi:uncharacterized protein with ParB-like and HNH nuclease domain
MVLDYRNQKINISNCNIYDFIRQLAAGEFLIPTFQRLFVWNPENISNLWDSIYRAYPIGTILFWKTRMQLHVHRKPGGFYIPEDATAAAKYKSYILDGQQRATSLLISFFGGTGKVREQHSFDFTLYFDLTKAVFFFEKDYYRHRWDADPAFLIPLKDVPGLPDDFAGQITKKTGFSEAVEKNLEQLKYLFSDYSIPLICLEGYDIAAVCAIYERINQTGTRLQNMDILIARGFKNYAAIVEEDFPVGE